MSGVRMLQINSTFKKIDKIHSNPPILQKYMYGFDYCKRCYFRGINFSRLAAQKLIRGC